MNDYPGPVNTPDLTTDDDDPVVTSGLYQPELIRYSLLVKGGPRGFFEVVDALVNYLGPDAANVQSVGKGNCGDYVVVSIGTWHARSVEAALNEWVTADLHPPFPAGSLLTWGKLGDQ